MVDAFGDVRRAFEDVDVPDADDAAAVRFEPARARGVAVGLFFFQVGCAVELDDEFGFGAKEVGDEAADRGLAAEAKAGELFAAQKRPELRSPSVIERRSWRARAVRLGIRQWAEGLAAA